jgi:hypothetical protein
MPIKRERAETRTFSYLEPVGMEWRTMRKRYAMKLSQDARTRALETINREMSEGAKALIRELGKDDPQWWMAMQCLPQSSWTHHFPTWNWLREVREGFKHDGLDEASMGVDNLDDYIIGLVEMAVGLTDQSREPPSTENIETGIVGRH